MEFFKQYDSGLKLSVKKTEGLMSIACGILVGVGSCKETVATNGFSHLIEHMVFKGTTTRTARQISEEMDDLGGNLNAFTGKETTCFFNKVLPDDVEKAIELLSDIFFNATFDQEELDRERKVVLEELSMDEDMPDDVCHDLIATAFYGDETLGYKVIGTRQNIIDVTSQKLIDFKKKFYVPHNMCISFAGDIDFELADRLVTKYFEEKFDNESKLIRVESLPVLKKEGKFLQCIKEVEQAHVAIAFDGFCSNSPISLDAKVGLVAFGGGMSSRLFQTIREQHGLAYSVFANASTFVNNGYVEIYLATSPKNVKKAVDLLFDEVQTVKKTGLTQKELDRGKTQLKTTLAFGCESTLSMMIAYGTNRLLFDKSFDIEDKLRRVSKIDLKSANDAVLSCLNFDTCAAAYVGKNCEGSKEPCRFVDFRNKNK